MTAYHTNGDPPPSTFAAQIVQNLTSARDRPGHGPKSTQLPRLLQQILDGDRRGDSQYGAVETDLDVNYQLIYVIVKAGLENLSTPNPFDDQEALVAQGLDCLAVITLTIKRSSAVLFAVPSSHETSIVPKGSLFLWLIPQLTNLLRLESHDKLIEATRTTLETAVSIQASSYTSKTHLNPVVKYIQGCINDLFLIVEGSESCEHDQSVLSNFRVPTIETVLEAFPYSAPEYDLQSTSLINHRDVSNNLSMILHLLQTLLYKANSKPSNIRVADNQTGWIIDFLLRLGPYLELPRHIVSVSLCLSFLVTVRTILATVSSLGNGIALCSRTAVLLCNYIGAVVESSSKEVLIATQHEICLALCDLFIMGTKSTFGPGICHVQLSILLPNIQTFFGRSDTIDLELQDLNVLLSRALDSVKTQRPFPTSQPQVSDFKDAGVREKLNQVISITERQLIQEEIPRARKRARTSTAGNGVASGRVDELYELLYSHLHVAPGTDLTDTNRLTSASSAGLSLEELSSAFLTIARIPCISATTTSGSVDQCSTCESESSSTLSYMDEVLCDELFVIIMKLLDLPQIPHSDRPRITAMIAIRHLCMHTQDPKHIDLSVSPSGQWCLHALASAQRELRLTAGRTLIAFLRNRLDATFMRDNRRTALNHLRSLSGKSDLALQETCVLAWGQIARVSGEDETEIVLLQLVEYLGHTNSMISGLAYDELLRLSNHSSTQVKRAFEPYWRTVAVTVVRAIQKRPQIVQQMSDLLGIDVAAFLRLTQEFTVPYLVLTKRGDILQRIANACVPPYPSVGALCMSRGNMPTILAYLLLHTASSEWETVIMSLLREASTDFLTVDLADVINLESVLTVSELLKAAGEEEEGKYGQVELPLSILSLYPQLTDEQAHQALEFLVTHNQRRSSSAKGSKHKRDPVGLFFEEYVLAIVTLFSETIDDSKGIHTNAEKKRCLRGLRQMIEIGKTHVYKAVPQISTYLQSAVEIDELCDVAFGAWMPLLDNLAKDDVESLIVPTFALLAQHWDSFHPTTQQRAHETISRLLKNQSSMIRDMVNNIPSLVSIPLMSKFEEELGKTKAQMDSKHQLQAFAERCENENATVVTRALTELELHLMSNQSFLHTLATSEQPDVVLSKLTRAILDACVRLNHTNAEVAMLAARCLGLIGCLDPTKIEAVKESKEIFVLNNFGTHDEIVEFVVFFFEEVLVKVFLSTRNSKSQGILAYAIQELLRVTGFDTSATFRTLDDNAKYHRWIAISESVRNTLSPYLTSRFLLSALAFQSFEYPIYRPGKKHVQWLRDFVLDLLQKSSGENTSLLFNIFRRVVRNQDIAIANFLLPFAVLNVVVGGTKKQQVNVSQEVRSILSQPLPDARLGGREDLISCSQNVFQTLDYMSRWVQEKKKDANRLNASASRNGHGSSELEHSMAMNQISSVECFLSEIPAEVLASRAVECKSFARALYYWEQYIRQQKDHYDDEDKRLEPLYERLQDIYTQIDEPDGIEGISAHLQVLNIDQQVLEHRKAGRWTAVQSWYELLLQKRPQDTEVQFSLLTSLRESGQHDVLLNQIAGFPISEPSTSMSRPFAVEAAWVTGKWDKLADHLAGLKIETGTDFNVGIGMALLALRTKDYQRSKEILDMLRCDIARTMSTNTTTSLQACHDTMLKFHVITEVEIIGGVHDLERPERPASLGSLDHRLEVLGAFLSDKQYSLGLRRAAMQLSRHKFSNLEISSTWLASARLARKSNSVHLAFNAVLHASQLGDNSATIEHSRLLWREGHHRKAIQSLEGAIVANTFSSHDYVESRETGAAREPSHQQQQNLLTARAHLLLAKWIDRAGQTQSDVIIKRYKKAVEFHNRWEKGHYYLGKHYNKLLESEKSKPPAKQAQTFISGETAKLVIENYLRSLAYGAKYIYQTLPRILTLWLGLGTDVDKPVDPGYGDDENFRQHTLAQRRKLFETVTKQMKKYIDRLPAFIFYTALPQIVARICHPNIIVSTSLIDIIAKVVGAHAQQATWTLLAVVKSSARERSNKGLACISKILDNERKAKGNQSGNDLHNLIQQGQKLSDQLLRVCEGHLESKQTTASISRDLGFVHRKLGYRLVIPLESTMTASLPVVSDNVNMKAHKAFSKDTITISAFLDDVLILMSLAKPRKVSIKGSDGRTYGLLCKPKDDLRKDQRLMEFNTMINRSLKKDAESSKRLLYIKTYAVTPLNEECGLIEWVDNLRTFRDILLMLYKQRNISPDYGRLRALLDEASSDEKKLPIFTREVLATFPPVFHEWFVDMFPEPGAWFTARLRYTRSCAVMSMVGHVLGLGDRHTENILFEEGNGGTFHVDFNCLFDKGLTFDKPELVPFRLTHNMIDAFGAYGYEGPFRKSCELTLGILRQNEDTLMTILETFLYDPTTDFIGKKKRIVRNVPDTPEGVLESVRNKVRGLLPMESVPLSVEGYVHELIQQATDTKRLAAMYIGWCAFF